MTITAKTIRADVKMPFLFEANMPIDPIGTKFGQWGINLDMTPKPASR